MKGNRKANEENRLIEVLESWPYATRSLRALPQAEMIEKHALWLLARSMSVGNLIAYVGSGTSMAYGRISWRNLGFQIADKAIEEFEGLPVDARSGRASALRNLLERTRNEAESRDSNDAILPLFQITEALFEAIDKGDRPSRFRRLINDFSSDDREHLAQFIELSAEDRRRKACSFMKVAGLKSQSFPADSLSAAIAYGFGRRAPGSLVATRLTPQQRFILAYLSKPKPDGLQLPRSDVYPITLDPLHLLLNELRINRYLTINYDSEIERLFNDAGMINARGGREDELQGSGQTARSNPLAPQYLSNTLNDDSAGDLIAFSLSDNHGEYKVFHLHGKSDPDIVVTEADYRRRYARSFPRLSLLEAASRLTLSCNPLLFLGVGMSEEDVLRPLRQIIDNNAIHPDRLVVALLPAIGKQATEVHAIKLLHRYGIHTIRYGSEKGADGKTNDYLQHIVGLIGNLKRILVEPGKRKQIIREIGDTSSRLDPPLFITNAPRETHEHHKTHKTLELELWFLRLLCDALLTNGRLNVSPEDRHRVTKSLEEIEGTFITSFLCEKLRHIHKESDDWNRLWGKEARKKRPLLYVHPPSQTTPTNRKSTPYTIESRHAQLLGDAVDELSYNRYYAYVSSRTFDDFHTALCALPMEQRRAGGRRLFLVTGRRGVGKGHFCSALVSPGRLQMLGGLINGGHAHEKVCYLNLGASIQIGSAIDSAITFFRGKEHADDINEGPRLSMLQKSLPTNSSPRHLLVINGVHRLLGPEGYAKNAQIVRFLHILLIESEKSNLDLFIIGDINWFRYCACCDIAPAPAHEGVRDFGFATQPSGDRRKKIHGRSFYEMLRSVPHFQYTLNSAEPERLLSNYFIGLCALFTDNGSLRGNAAFTATVELVRKEVERYRNQQEAIYGGSARHETIESVHHEPEPNSPLGQLLPNGLLNSVWKACGRSRYLMCVLLSCCDEAARRSLALMGEGNDGEDARAAIVSFMERSLSELKTIRVEHRAIRLIDLVFREYQARSEQSQPCLTQADLDKIFPPSEAGKPTSTLPEDSERYRAWTCSVRFYDLMQVVIWHLAVVDQPMEGAALCRCPLVVAAVENLTGGTATERLPVHGDQDHSGRLAMQVERLVELALKVLMARSLAFQFSPRENNSKEKDAQWQVGRYSVHRVLQSAVFSKLGSAFLEFPQIDYFTVTLYATQPDDLPTLSAEAHANLFRTVAALVGYPESPDLGMYHDAADDSVRIYMLRAALGIIRSVFSVSVLLRAQSASGQSLSKESECGVIEEHRRLVYWMYGAARNMADAKPGPDVAETDTAVFYREEAAWLLNEVGLMSLIQGRMHDAMSLFDRALGMANVIDGSSRGALSCRIGLNRAIVDIERGRFNDALALLDQISNTWDESVVMKRIADGYRGLVFHLKGRLTEAERLYRQALEGVGYASGNHAIQRRYADYGLVALCRSRAASIFARHLGDLYRSRDDFDKAKEYLRLSLHLAQEGRHEDVRHLTILSTTRIGLHRSTREDPRIAHAQLLEVERYSRSLGLPRIIAETLEISARYQLAAGDAQSARELALSALELANLHGLRLRKISCMLVLANALRGLGELRAAQSVASAALRSAERSDYHAAFADAQQLLARLDAFNQ